MSDPLAFVEVLRYMRSMRRCRSTRVVMAAAAVAVLTACGDDDGPAGDGGVPDAAVDLGPAEAAMDFAGAVDTQESFFDFPLPSDLRLAADGTPDLTGFPNPQSLDIVADVLSVVADHPRWSTLPVAHFRFSAPIAALDPSAVIPAEPGSPALLVDVDPDSPDRGRLFPLVGLDLADDRYTGRNLLSLAARPGFVLEPDRTYAFVVMRAFGDAMGRPLVVPDALARLKDGVAPEGAWGPDAVALYAPLWETLDTLGVDRAEVATATVFTTGDVVARLHEMSDRIVEREDVTFDALRLDTDGDHDRYCELVGRISMPHFQQGTPPFDEGGVFVYGSDGLPVEQFREDAPVVLAIPKTPMPDAGYPLMVYFHGSGGLASQVVDRGPQPPGIRGTGPAHMVAVHSIASVGAALPLSPDRLPGASPIAYLNLENLAAFPYTFQQGVIEQRLMIEALESLEIPPAALGGCTGPELPSGATAFRFDTDHFVGLGQSMGGMYTNLMGAVEPRLSALVPTGAGGYWGQFILETSLLDARDLLGLLLGTRGADLSFMHPVLALVALAWEAAEPFAYAPRLSRRPLDGIPARPVYEPVGLGDSYFPPATFDGIALAYGHPQAGEIVWPEMQDALALAGLDGIVPYPIADNLTNYRGETYTAAVVQSAGDGFSDPHVIYVQVEDIRHQWTCFLKTAIDGTAVIPPPAAEGTPCPTM